MPMEIGSVSTGMVDFVVRADKKVWFGSGLFKNWYSLFSTLGALQFLVTNVLTTLVARGLPCQVMLQVLPPRWLTGEGFVSWNCVAKCLACMLFSVLHLPSIFGQSFCEAMHSSCDPGHLETLNLFHQSAQHERGRDILTTALNLFSSNNSGACFIVQGK